MIDTPSIRRVPPQDGDEEKFRLPDDGRFIATFFLDHDAGFARYTVHLPLTDDDPTLTDLEARARAVLKERLQAIVDQI